MELRRTGSPRIILVLSRYELTKAAINNEDQTRSIIHFSARCLIASASGEDAAIREGELAVGLLPVSRDHFAGPELVWNLARIYTMFDRSDAAIDWLEYLLSIPSAYSAHLLRLDPAFDPLRENPRFQKLVGESG